MDIFETLKQRVGARLQLKLMVEENIPRAYAAILSDNALNHFDDRVRQGVLLWLDDRLPEDFAVEDATLAEIEEYFGLTGFPALCVMDMYLKNPDFLRDEVDWLERSEL